MKKFGETPKVGEEKVVESDAAERMAISILEEVEKDNREAEVDPEKFSRLVGERIAKEEEQIRVKLEAIEKLKKRLETWERNSGK
jgi:hypothetical protein